jgi:hypothetical protein
MSTKSKLTMRENQILCCVGSSGITPWQIKCQYTLKDKKGKLLTVEIISKVLRALYAKDYLKRTKSGNTFLYSRDEHHHN